MTKVATSLETKMATGARPFAGRPVGYSKPAGRVNERMGQLAAARSTRSIDIGGPNHAHREFTVLPFESNVPGARQNVLISEVPINGTVRWQQRRRR